MTEKSEYFFLRCYDRCFTEGESCCSYEYSPHRRMCNLNKECEPTDKKHADFLFCRRHDAAQKINSTSAGKCLFSCEQKIIHCHRAEVRSAKNHQVVAQLVTKQSPSSSLVVST